MISASVLIVSLMVAHGKSMKTRAAAPGRRVGVTKRAARGKG
jgi:hypothetical protein